MVSHVRKSIENYSGENRTMFSKLKWPLNLFIFSETCVCLTKFMLCGSLRSQRFEFVAIILSYWLDMYGYFVECIRMNTNTASMIQFQPYFIQNFTISKLNAFMRMVVCPFFLCWEAIQEACIQIQNYKADLVFFLNRKLDLSANYFQKAKEKLML